ncbi:MAG TPA: hypothetical protein VG269_27885 [Tepidisphaeraceae bacterium]|jgi:hypothetical protein|nr:hypothetical protein [Tepidisphaeraceae bacterium]
MVGMLGRLRAILSLLSLLLFVATCGLWVRSYIAADIVAWHCRDMRLPLPAEEWYTRRMDLGSCRGIIGLDFERIDWPNAYPNYREPPGNWHWRLDGWQRVDPKESYGFDPRSYEPDSAWHRLGFGYSHTPSATLWNDYDSQFIPTKAIILCVPHWALALAAAVAPAMTLRKWRKRRANVASNHCTHCGYDLRATPERCPECGREASAVKLVTSKGIGTRARGRNAEC